MASMERNGKRSCLGKIARSGLVLLILGAGARLGVAQTLLSETTWGGTDSEVTEAAAVAADGSAYLAGGTRSFGTSDTPIVFIVKFAVDGSVAWQRTWDGPDPFFGDEARDAAVAPDGSVYVAGTTLGVAGDALLLKFASDGTPISQQTWGTSTNDRGEAVAVASDGSTYLVGSTRASDPDVSDIFVVKFAPGGALVWQKTWGTLGGFEEGQGVAVGPDGSVYVAGYTPRPDVIFGFDAVLLKLDPDGNLLWQTARM